ncbi:MAG: amino acid--tRNA ligase-related protein, partial [Pseudomonadota bacterium]|nr:amino acid--tRNA ligase-related protein [Pseudomonadota bacterium]
PVFRGGDIGPKHQPEFTMAEWYAPGLELPLLMDEMVNLIRELPFVPQAFSDPVKHFRYRELMIEHAGVDPEGVDDPALRRRLDQYPIESNHLGDLADSQWRSDVLDFLFSNEVQPRLTGLCTVTGFPKSQAALAEIDDASGLSLRTELFFSGLELINGYQELRDTDELERRWAEANAARAARGLAQLALDEGLKAAMADMPLSAGAAMGVDRLVLCLLGLERLDQAMVLPWV